MTASGVRDLVDTRYRTTPVIIAGRRLPRHGRPLRAEFSRRRPIGEHTRMNRLTAWIDAILTGARPITGALAPT
jgi:hypothetical protein